jgi:hypothetical protein
LTPGDRSITVEALSGAQVVSSFTFPLKVYAAMELLVSPEADPLIVQKGAQVTLEATARDRNGKTLTGDAITWTSHIDGQAGKGVTLDLASMAGLSIGEHVFTVEAAGSYGAVARVFKHILVNAPAEETGEQGGDDNQEGGSGSGGVPAGSGGLAPAFDPGNPVPPPFGSPGSPLIPPGGTMPPGFMGGTFGAGAGGGLGGGISGGLFGGAGGLFGGGSSGGPVF